MKTIIISSIILVLMCVNLFSQHERLPIQSDEEKVTMNLSKPAITDSTALDSVILDHMNFYHIPGLTALINTKEDGIIWKRNYGYANVGLQQPIEDSTLFLMASISKTIVATAIMQFWEADSFDLDDNINDYLDDFQVINPYFPNDTITFRMLMIHTSSIHDYWPILTPLAICNEDSPIPLDSFLVNYLTQGGVFYSSFNFNSDSLEAPSENYWDYSNVGVALLAYIVEKFSGIPFDQYCRDNIFNPLEMEKTTWFLAGLDTTTLATQYKWIGGQYVPQCHQGWPPYPAGFLKTNKIELEHFLRAYMNWGKYNGATILDSSTIALMLSDHLGYHIEEYNDIQGLVWYQYGRVDDVWPWGHEGGWTLGTRTAMLFKMEENWGVIYFMNMYYSGLSTAHLFILNTLCDYARVITDVEEISSPVADFNLEQNFPNPFNPVTTIKYKIPELSFVIIKVYDVLGNEIVTLVNSEKSTGNYEIEFNASHLSSGIYFYRLQAGSFVETKKMILLK